MEILYDLIILIVVIVFGYWSREEKENFTFTIIILIVSGLLMGIFLNGMEIYGILFLIGFVVDRAYIRYKWPEGKKPKSYGYKKARDWFDRIFATLIIVLSIDIVSRYVSVHYSFIVFFLGIVTSCLLKDIENIKQFLGMK